MKSREHLKKGQKRNTVHSGTTAQRSRDLLTEVGVPQRTEGEGPLETGIPPQRSGGPSGKMGVGTRKGGGPA